MMFPPEFFESVKPNGRLSRGRSYDDPIGEMVRAIPPDCKHTPVDIIEALHERGYRVVLVEASMLRIMEQIARNRDQSARAAYATATGSAS